MANDTAAILVGVLHDHMQPGYEERFTQMVQLGLDAVGTRLDRPVELVHVPAAGLPRGTAHAVREAFGQLEARGVVAILGPAISDNGIVVRPLADAAELACINYTGGEETRSEWSFQYQVGSLEEEPLVLARHLARRGLRRVALVHDRSPIGRSYVTFFESGCDTFDIEIVARAGVSPVVDGLDDVVAAAQGTDADAVVYLGLGLSAEPLGRAIAARRWLVPVVANSALMFGYANPEWARLWDGWTFIDAVADDNALLAELYRRLGSAAVPGPGVPAQHDLGRLLGEGIARADHLTRAGIRSGLERVKLIPAAIGREGTTMGFGVWDRAALKGEYLVLRRWEAGRSVEVPRDDAS
ncbi:MAG TPA: ABC transporter substrate-binding protein [Acidimicrobiia bacterium]|nr:ABC transporter substrate-binding protein [Acidimicrobiia bacterium]